MKRYSTLVWLAMIVLLGVVLRLWMLPSAPERLTQDEMSIGYNAFSLTRTGMDEWGKTWPVIFKAFGDDKMPVYVYAAMPFVSLFGLSALGVKLPSVIAGLLAILGVYLIGKEVTKRESVGLLAGLMVAINPMPVHLSRSGLESNLALALFVWGFYLLLIYSRRKKMWLGVASGLVLGMSMFTYVGYRMVVLGTWLGYGVIEYFDSTNVKKTVEHVMFPLVGVLLVALPLMMLGGQRSMTRFTQLAATQETGVQAESLDISNYCFMSGMPLLQKSCRVMFAPAIERLVVVADNYVAYLLPNFLFVEGDQIAYLSDPKFGEFFLLWLPFMVFGVYGIWKFKSLSSKLLLIIFLLSPVAAALVGAPQIVRGSSIVMPVSVFIGMGLVMAYDWISDKKWKWVAIVGFTMLVVGQMGRYYSHYFYVYPKKYAREFYGIPNEVAGYLKGLENEYETIYISDRFSNPHMFLAFWQKIDPSIYQQEIVHPESEDELGFSHPIALFNYRFGSDDLTTYLCDEDIDRFLYITDTEQKRIEATEEFTDFTGVHSEVFVFDINEVRKQLRAEKVYERVCPGV